jgi:photosystem II stability/assembly factor-like uncharacterized protein
VTASGLTGIYYNRFVGIGTTGPNFDLDVNGTINFNSIYQTTPGATGALPYSQVSYDPGSSLSGLQMVPSNWKSSSGATKPWSSISLSSSGQYQSACVLSGGILYSSDYGNTWTGYSAAPQLWTSISLSSSGQYQGACVSDGIIWYSSDYGNNWAPTSASVQPYTSISLSSSGQYQSACVSSGGIYSSSNYGNTWTQTSYSQLAWTSISLSSSGQYQSACVSSGGIYSSSNYGNTWTQTSASSTQSYTSISLSSSGQYQSACVSSGGIYSSSNYGKTWTQTSASSTQAYSSISLSSSGQYQSACTNPGYIYTTNNTISFGLGSTGLSGITGATAYSIPANYYQVLYYAPTAGATGANTPYLVYNSSANKTFVIDHPYEQDKYLVHACLEGPESGVYYRGKNKITNNKKVIITLPYYVDRLATDFTVSVTPINKDDSSSDSSSDSEEKEQISLSCSCVKKNKFKVYGKNCDFYWIVYGKRDNINVEPLKALTNVKGEGPYKYL